MRVIASFVVLVLLLQGCADKNGEFAHSIFQTNGATLMRDYHLLLDKMLLKLGKKLIKRNREIFSKEILWYLKNDMENHSDTINLPLVKNLKKDNFKDYLRIAFSKNKVRDRGDYLLVGLYKMFYWSFGGDSFHKLSALQYDGKKLQLGYEILQVVAWKIKVARDKNGDYLFLTWQNNWQIELEKRVKKGERLSVKLIKNLKYIKNKKESLLSPSNLSFEVIFGKMEFIYEQALKTVGIEPKSLGADALRSLFLIL